MSEKLSPTPLDANEKFAPLEEIKPGEALDLCNRLAAANRLGRCTADQERDSWEKLARAIAKRFDALGTDQESVWRLRAEEVGALGTQSPTQSETKRDTSTPEGHRQRHVELHKAMDELLADYMRNHRDQQSFLDMPFRQLMEWSHRQTIQPDEVAK